MSNAGRGGRGIRWFLDLFREELARRLIRWAIGVGLFLLALLLPSVRSALSYLIEMPVWLLLILLCIAGVTPWAIASIRQRRAAKQKFRPIDILTPDLPIQLLWRLKQPVEDWINVNTNATSSSYVMSILDGPLCGKRTGRRTYCRNQVSTPPKRHLDGDSWRVYWRCRVCNAGMDDEEMRDKYMHVNEVRKEVIEALQRHVHNGGKIRDKMPLNFVD